MTTLVITVIVAIAPGEVSYSMILTRINSTDATRMPPVASNEYDSDAGALLSTWINGDLTTLQSYTEWAATARSGETATLKNQDPNDDSQSNHLVYLVKTDPQDPYERVLKEVLDATILGSLPKEAPKHLRVRRQSE